MQRIALNHWSRAAALAALALFLNTAAAEPVATLPMYNHVGEQLMASGGRTREDVAKDIPSKDEVGMPVYPGLFYSGTISAEGMMPAVVLASGDAMETIHAWYAEQQGLSYDEESKVFYSGESYVMGETASVFLQDISENPESSVGGMVFDMHGMKTQITVSYRATEGDDDV